ncbi:retention module-containing protein, partial [Pseudomonas sp. MOB-449]|nr:retention module-containing protein [Pseudomonas sp. MOB-449]
MAGSIGVVRQVVGEVFAVAADGSRRALSEGDRVFAGEQLVTGALGAVAVTLANGQELVLGRESSMPLNNALLAGAPDDTQPGMDNPPATPSQQDLTDVEKLQAAIAAGVDPTQAAEATAAGPGGGAGGGNAGGGHSFVLLGETAGRVDPNIGFPTGPIAFAVDFPQPETGIPDIPLAAPVEVPVNGVPTAVDDGQTVTEGQEGVQGNVLDNDDGGPDLPTTFVSWQAPGASSGPDGSLLLNTPYGVVTLNPDGSYSFVLANGTPLVEGLGEGESVQLTYGYSIQDSNGDQSSATLTITVNGSNDIPTVEVNFPDAGGGVVRVFESGLPGGSSAGDGSNVVHGTFTIRDPDGLDKLKSLGVGGLDLQIDSVNPLGSLIGRGFDAAYGTVQITGFDLSTGTFSFSYTLTRPITDLAAGEERDGFLISLSDGLGLPVSANVSIEIVDDVPQANPDSRSLTENGVPSSLSGNVLGNDVGGADQPKAFSSWNGVAGATVGEGGSLLVNTPYG